MNHYQVLGLTPGAGGADIAMAYNRGLAALREALARGEAPHPGGLDALREAWKVLGDATRRAAYDRTLAPAAPAAPIATAALKKPVAPTLRLPFEFTGSGTEYFRIWIVNLLLSILTLGIYSAWAKVRREQYFHRSLQLENSGFDYHGTPKAILRGRIITFGLLMVLSVTEKISPAAYWLALLILAPALPWLIVRALRFRAGNTSFRGLRFRFTGTYRQACTVFLGYGLLTAITLGLALPLFVQRVRRFTLGNLQYGATPLVCTVTAGQFYRIYALPIFAAALLIAVTALVFAIGGASMAKLLLIPLLLLIGLGLVLVVGPYLRVRGSNATWNATALADGHFESTMSVRGYLGLAIGNMFMLALTLGFFWPWAKVRMARYQAQNMAFSLPGSLDDFIAGEAAQASALGDEVAEMLDLDLGA